MKRWVLIGASCAMLAGCVTPEQLAARDDAVCQSYGAAYGTPQYTDCRMRVAQQRQQAVQAAFAQMNENLRQQQEANQRAMETYMQATKPAPMPTNTTTTCTRTSATTVSCNSF